MLTHLKIVPNSLIFKLENGQFMLTIYTGIAPIK